MKYGGLPGGPPQRQRSSPARIVASHILSRMRRPGRIRSWMFLLFITLFGIIFIFYGRRHATELQFSASTLTNYIPTSITDAIATYGKPEDTDTRWNEVDSKNSTDHIVIKKPKFHLLIPTNNPSVNLCKTLLSAAILNYPPPTLISYGESPDSERPGMDVVKNTFSFLLGKEVHDDDLVLIVDEDTIFQLPASVTISRFLHTSQDTSTKLLPKYGQVPNTNDTNLPNSQRPPKYTHKILFGATTSCSSPLDDPACHSIPESPLPKDIYSSSPSQANQTGLENEEVNHPPHHISPSLHIGRASSLRPLYKHLSELLEFSAQGKEGSQQTIAQIYSEQEHARTLSLASPKSNIPAWRNWLASVFTNTKTNQEDTYIPTNPLNQTLDADQIQNYEFGISLDYVNSIFQAMQSSSADIEIIRFDQASDIIKEPSKSQAATYKIKRPIQLPADLENAPPPFGVQDKDEEDISNTNTTTSLDESTKDKDKDEDTPHSWSSLPLWTNTRVPTSSVPAMLGFHDTDAEPNTNGIKNINDTWKKMWFHNSTRSLLQSHLSSTDSNEPISDNAGERWFDVRGGKGGVWTQRGEWVPWETVCGGFGDGEDEYVGGEKDLKKEDGKGEGEGVVKGFWGKIVGVMDGEEKEDGEGKGDGYVVGGFLQSEILSSGHSDGKIDSGDSKNDDDKEGEDEKKEGDGKDDPSHEVDPSNNGEKKEDGEKEDDTKKDDGKKEDVQKIDLDDNEKEKYKDQESANGEGHAGGGSGGTTVSEAKVEEGAVRYADEKQYAVQDEEGDKKSRGDK